MFTRNSIVRSVAGGLVLAGMAFPGAAMATFPNEQDGTIGATAVLNSEGGTIGATAVLHDGQPAVQSSATSQAEPAHITPPAQTKPQPSASAGPSFQWGDAGIGAGGATVLLSAAALGASATRRRRRTVIG